MAQSLAVEIGKQVLWSILTYSQEELAQLFDGRRMFKSAPAPHQQGFIFADGEEVTPALAAYSYQFLRTNDLIGSSRYDTIVRILNWCSDNLRHTAIRTAGDGIKFWNYYGDPLMKSILEGIKDPTNPKVLWHWTEGCWCTTGLLRLLLSAINIPVKLIQNGVTRDNTGQIVDEGHAQPWFMADDLHLSHGDDPYDQFMNLEEPVDIGGVPPIPTDKLLINATTFNNWFGSSVSDKQNRANIGRQLLELGIQYLPNYLLKSYCNDRIAGKNHANGTVFQQFVYKDNNTDPNPIFIYSLAQLEAMKLWDRIEAKITALCECGNFRE